MRSVLPRTTCAPASFSRREHLARARPVHAQVARRDDTIGAAGCGEIRETRFERNRVSVDVGENRDPH